MSDDNFGSFGEEARSAIEEKLLTIKDKTSLSLSFKSVSKVYWIIAVCCFRRKIYGGPEIHSSQVRRLRKDLLGKVVQALRPGVLVVAVSDNRWENMVQGIDECLQENLLFYCHY